MLADLSPWQIFSPVALALSALAAAYAYMRSSAAKVWEENARAYREKIDILVDENTELKGKVARLEARTAELEKRPDLREVLAMISETRPAIEESLDTLELRLRVLAAGIEEKVLTAIKEGSGGSR